MLKIEKVTVQYENLIAVDQIELELPAGKIHGLVGPNGAGKSSLLSVCAGLVREYTGKIYFGEYENRENRSWVKRHLGYAPEDTELLPYLTTSEFLRLIQTIKTSSQNTSERNSLIEMLGLEGKLNDLVCDLSHGMKQKLLLASAFIGNPEYLIIDEALNGLDPVALNNLKQYLTDMCKQGGTILISSHVLPLIQDWSDQVYLMHEGKLIGQYSKTDLEQMKTSRQIDLTKIFLEKTAENKSRYI